MSAPQPARFRKARGTAVVGALAALLAVALPAAPAVAAEETYSYPSAISFVDGGSAAPATISVDGPASIVRDVNVSLTITHSFLADVDVLLVGPQGQSVILMSDVGCGNPASDVALTFDQSASSDLPGNAAPTAGTYRPTNVSPGCDGGSDTFPLAPAGPWGGSLNVFNGTNPVGDWRLFLADDVGSYGGQVTSWSLTIDADAPEAPEVTSPATASGIVGEPFSHTFTASGVPDATFSYSSADLPPGVTRSGDTLSGTPTAPGEYSITATAGNGIVPDATQTLAITVTERPAITSAAAATAAARRSPTPSRQVDRQRPPSPTRQCPCPTA